MIFFISAKDLLLNVDNFHKHNNEAIFENVHQSFSECLLNVVNI